MLLLVIMLKTALQHLLHLVQLLKVRNSKVGIKPLKAMMPLILPLQLTKIRSFTLTIELISTPLTLNMLLMVLKQSMKLQQ